MLTTFFFLAGVALLIVGAEALVRGASRLAAAVGVSPLIIGLTVVAFGTSAPEFAVSFNAAMVDQAGITIGNIVGSNICNILFILGLSAVAAPLVVSQQLIRLDVPLMIGASLLAWGLGADGDYGRLDGVLLFGGLLAYLVFLARMSRRERPEILDEYTREYGAATPPGRHRTLQYLGLIVVGLAMLILGSKWLVDSAVILARLLGVSELIVGLTVVALGTSLPEVVTSVVASLRGERDIAVGNLVGSNLFNVLGVLGLTGLLSPSPIAVTAGALNFDMPVMVAVAVACFPIMFANNLVTRAEGGLLVAFYAAYVYYIFLTATSHESQPLFGAAMLYGVLPLTAVILLMQTGGGLRARLSARRGRHRLRK